MSSCGWTPAIGDSRWCGIRAETVVRPAILHGKALVDMCTTHCLQTQWRMSTNNWTKRIRGLLCDHQQSP